MTPGTHLGGSERASPLCVHDTHMGHCFALLLLSFLSSVVVFVSFLLSCSSVVFFCRLLLSSSPVFRRVLVLSLLLFSVFCLLSSVFRLLKAPLSCQRCTPDPLIFCTIFYSFGSTFSFFPDFLPPLSPQVGGGPPQRLESGEKSCSIKTSMV